MTGVGVLFKKGLTKRTECGRIVAKKDAKGNLHDDSNGRFTNKNKQSALEKKYNDDLVPNTTKPEKAYGFANNERKGTNHHKAHAKEMGFKNQDEYEKEACRFFNSDEGDLYYSERRKRFYLYDKKNKRMCVSSDGIIHTFMVKTEKEFNKTVNGDKLKWIR